MAKKQHNEVAVGITVIVVLALTVYIVVALADWSDIITRKQEITVQLPYEVGLKGLLPGSPVFLGGAKIGQICSIQRPAASDEAGGKLYVYFTMMIPAQYQLRHDCVLSPESNVLGGQAFLAIKDLGSKGEIIQDGQTVKLAVEGSIADTMAAIKRELNADVSGSVMHRLKYEISRENADSIVASVAAAVANLREITEEIKGLIQTNKTPFNETMVSVRNTAKNIEGDIPEISAKLKVALDKATGAIDTAQAALDNLKELTGAAKETILVNRETIDKIIRNMNEVGVNLKLASREIRRAPWKLLYKPGKNEQQLQAMVDSAGAFATGAESLDETTLRLRALLTSSGEQIPLESKRLQAIIGELEISFDRFKKAEEKFWEEID